MNCSACKKYLDTKECMKCRLCTSKFHIQCLNIDKKQFLTLNKEYKATWICPACSSVTRRARSNDNTPVRQSTSMAPASDSMNMSCDLDDPGTTSPTGVLSSPRATFNKEEITLERISILLDEKLSASLSAFMESFRMALRDDVKEMVKNEIGSTMDAIKEEFSATTDFICAEQKSLQSDITKTATKIKSLEDENTKLQVEINRLNTRLATIEKISRSCNIELQAATERRNENVVALFKNLCEAVKASVDDSHISACRRVAKQNTASNRPRNIIVTFSSPRVRDLVLSATHRYNKSHSGRGLLSSDLGITGDACKIYVNEHLSPELKSLHAATRKVARDHNYKYVWIKYSQIYVRKDDSSGALLVNNTESLSKIN
ncbi:uncharacterized protein LOC114362097 [Ostrinia furnacalis]|uniref:uncharacterized protein LOC114362097 n=1 Tax=Ostrinia furnacalis TaxID=93504 RepID=UPI0010404BA0|nr:uncharacterized protein LOC114362097 [Ostrinia furnacalis]